MSGEASILILDTESGQVLDRCSGPDAGGRCPRVEAGEILPCAAHALIPAAAHGGQPYAVPGQATLCPITVAMALAGAPDAALLED